MNARILAFVCAACAGCTSSSGEVFLNFVWEDEPSFPNQVYLVLRLEASGAVIEELAPLPFSRNETFDFDLLPIERELVVIAEVRDGGFKNSRALYYGISAPFVLHTGEKLEVTTKLVEGPPRYSPPSGPPPPVIDKLALIRTARELRLFGEEGVAPANNTLLFFSAADVARATELGRVSIPERGGFELVLETAQGRNKLQPIYAAVLGADDLLSDNSDRPGLQASMITKTVVTLPNGKLVYKTALTSAAREPPEHVRTAVPESELGSIIRSVASPVWRLQPNPRIRPEARVNTALAYDAWRGRVVMFGGSNETYLNDLWVHDGERWSNETPVASPDPRVDHALVYDAARDRVLLFGGQANGTVLGDFWEWDGALWKNIPAASDSPPPRARHALVYDARRGVVVLFGGRDEEGGLYFDTWEWDGTQWSPAADGPARADHAMTFDRTNGVVLMFGGRSDDGVEQDLWSFDGGAWSPIETSGDLPPKRERAAIAFDEARSKLVLFGGLDRSGDAIGELHELEGTRWRRLIEAGPASRSDHAMIYNAAAKSVLLFGGRLELGAIDYDTWTWDGARFTDRTPTMSRAPRPLNRHVMVYDNDRDRAVIIGGEVGHVERSSDHWEWGPTGWSLRADIGIPWRGHQIAYDSWRGRLVMYGGVPAGTFEWIDDRWQPRSSARIPPGRYGHRMIFDKRRGVTVMFGGGIPDETFAWEWDGNDWSPTIPPGPISFVNHTMAFDTKFQSVLLHGGEQVGGHYGNTFLYDGQQWLTLSRFTSFALSKHVMVYDGARERLLIHGGAKVTSDDPNVTITDELRVWDGNDWLLVETAGRPPARRSDHAMIYDPIRQRLVMSGGTDMPVASVYDELWTLDMPLGQKSSVDVVLDLDDALPKDAEIDTLELRATAGGRGCPDGGREFQDGSAVSAWNMPAGAFLELASNDAPLDAPATLSATVAVAAEVIDRDRRIVLRFEPRFGNGKMLEDAAVAAGALEVRVRARLSAPSNEDTP